MGTLLAGHSPKAPKIKPPPPPANPPTIANPAVTAAGNQATARARAAAGGGMSGTVVSGPKGLEAPPVAQASLLGGAG